MGSNIIELAKLGHERSAELKASCGAVDVRSLAQLISDLATQLEVQLVRGNEQAVQLANAESKCRELAAENVYLLPKAASELSNAWVLHKYLIGIQAAIMYLDGGSKKAAQEWLYGTIAGPGFEFPDEVEVGDDIDAWATHQMRDSISHPRALEIIKAETPATDTFLAEVRASGVESAINTVIAMMNHQHPVTSKAIDILRVHAAQLRKGAAL
ncbi:hypothetical protein EBJ67_08330 [Salmonella enterica subsp. enterica serovar Bovismorbificans]|nr:hypothetical protein [Salmonella enterica subsp. enterica serovar Bovismorbificans]